MVQDKNQKTLNVPPLRFTGFTDEWKRSTLKDYLIENKERNSRGEFSKDEVLSVSGDKGIVNQIQLLGRSYAGQSVLPYHIVRRNNIVYTKSPLSEFPYGIVKMNRGKDGIVSTLYAVYSVLDSADPSFIEYYFASKDRTNRYFKPIVRIGAKHDMKIGNTEVLENQVNFPDKTEQCRISEFLELIDERIDTQNKIIEDLKKLKSAIIDRLYSEVKGVICTYSELFTVVTERNSKRIYNKVIAASQEYGMVERESLNLKVQFDEESINTYKIINSGDYVIHLRSFQGGFAFSRLQGICSPAYIILRPNNRVEYSYFENYFTSAKFINSLRLVTYGIRDGRSINVEEWLSMEVTLPSKEEQKRIIRTIQSIQDKVSNEINILTSLHSQRLFLLRELFI